MIIVGKGPRRQPPRQSGPLGGMGKTGVRIRCRRIAPFSGKIRLPGGRHVPTYLQTSDFIRPPRRRDNGKIGNLPAYGSCPQKSALSSARHPCIRKNLQLEVAGFSFADSGRLAVRRGFYPNPRNTPCIRRLHALPNEAGYTLVTRFHTSKSASMNALSMNLYTANVTSFSGTCKLLLINNSR